MKVRTENLVQTLEGKMKEGYTYLVKITAIDYIDRIEASYIIIDEIGSA